MAVYILRLAVSVAVLFGFWLLLSGNYKAWLVWSGLGASVLVVAFSASKRVVDFEGFPVEWLPRAVPYWGWLLGQIVRSALGVTRLVLAREPAISPTMVAVRAEQHSAVGIATYANSITLTPGTLAVEVGEQARTIWVHAITRENAEGFADDAMNHWVAWVDGEAPERKGEPA